MKRITQFCILTLAVFSLYQAYNINASQKNNKIIIEHESNPMP